jgi:hypothetical protein
MLSGTLELTWKDHKITLAQESPDLPRHNPRSADNHVGRDERELFLGDCSNRPSSRCRASISRGEVPVACCVLLADGGASGVHNRSALIHGDTLMVAVGAFVCALQLPELVLRWHTRADTATCFGVYDAPSWDSLISHGELEIARLSYSGQVLWSSSGRDIFSEAFTLFERHAEAVDCDGTKYRIHLETGTIEIIAN